MPNFYRLFFILFAFIVLPLKAHELTCLKKTNQIIYPPFKNFNEVKFLKYFALYSNDERMYLNPESLEEKLAFMHFLEKKYIGLNITPNFKDSIQNLSPKDLEKLKEDLNSFDLTSPKTRENLDLFTHNFFEVIKGPGFSYLKKPTFFRILEEELFMMGLRQTLEQIAEKNNLPHHLTHNLNSKQKLDLYLKRIMKHKIWRFFISPDDLAFTKKLNLSDKLLQSILKDGLSFHQDEVLAILKEKKQSNHFQRLKKITGSITAGVGFYFFYNILENKFDH